MALFVIRRTSSASDTCWSRSDFAVLRVPEKGLVSESPPRVCVCGLVCLALLVLAGSYSNYNPMVAC